MRRTLALVTAAALFGLSAQAASAELRVVRAVGPSAKQYAAGTKLPDGHRFALRPGDTLVVLRSGGGRVVLRGPGVGTAQVLALQNRRRDENKPLAAGAAR